MRMYEKYSLGALVSEHQNIQFADRAGQTSGLVVVGVLMPLDNLGRLPGLSAPGGSVPGVAIVPSGDTRNREVLVKVWPMDSKRGQFDMRALLFGAPSQARIILRTKAVLSAAFHRYGYVTLRI